MKNKTITYNWNDKHIAFMRKSKECNYNVAEGSIRSGKSTDIVYMFAYWLKRTKDTVHLVTASTQPTAKLIVGDCDGKGLEHIFRGQCRWGKYKGNDALIIKGVDTGYKQRIVLFCGGGKADSFKKFRGFTIGMWLATEINLHHPETIREAMKRQLKAHTKKLFWDLNPEAPNDYIYTEYLDRWQEEADKGEFVGGYNYESFNIYDNINISEQNLKEFVSKYTEGTVYYIRDVLGKRSVAQGVVFPQFSADPTPWLISADKVPKHLEYVSGGFDIGGNLSAYGMTVAGIDYSGDVYFLYSKKTQAKDLAMDKVVEIVENAVEYVEKTHKGNDVETTYCDHVDVVINQINQNTRHRAVKTYKPPLEDRPFLFSKLLAKKKVFFVKETCGDLIEELQNLVFDDKQEKAVVKDDGTMQIDTWDSACYALANRRWRYLLEEY